MVNILSESPRTAWERSERYSAEHPTVASAGQCGVVLLPQGRPADAELADGLLGHGDASPDNAAAVEELDTYEDPVQGQLRTYDSLRDDTATFTE